MTAAPPQPPGLSFLREERVTIHAGPNGAGTSLQLGMSPPTETDDGWWLAVVWAGDSEGIVNARSIAPQTGPPPDPPLGLIGPAFAGALSGLIAQEDGRQLVRLRLPPAADESRPWERPLIVQLAIKWEPVRQLTMTRNQLAREALRAFGSAIVACGRP